MGITVEKHTEPESRGERVARYVEAYLAAHGGLSRGELAFRLRADKRDLERLLSLRSVGWRLEDSLAAYFGDDFIEAVFRPVIGDRGSRRLQEIERERAELAAREARLAQARQARRAAPSRSLWVVPDEAGRLGA